MDVTTSPARSVRRKQNRRGSRRNPAAGDHSAMRRWCSHAAVLTLGIGLVAVTGCMSKKANVFQRDHDEALYESVAARVDYPDLELVCEPELDPGATPHTLRDMEKPEYWDLELQSAIQYALEHSDVLRDLGGSVLRTPEQVQTGYSVAIQNTDPRFGAEAALSAFDAQFAASGFFEKNDRRLNNTFFGGGTRILRQDVNDYQMQISKFGVTGGEYALRNKINYDNNNAPGNAFPHAYTDELEAEIRHPLLQGAGAEFNRLAGPSRTPGLVNGVMVARVNNKITQADFELALRDYISNVENAYWDLYFAYRNLDAKIQARDRALETWRIVRALQKEDRRGGEADKEALAREQYYRFQEEVQNALTGRQEDGTRTNNGSTGGAFRGTGGVHIAERRLRLLMGVSINEGRLIRPTDEPEMARIVHDWQAVVAEAHARRTELKRQRLLVERREMELLANRNFLSPRLDAVGLYRWRGFGRDLIEQGGNQSAVDELTGGGFQEWQLGVQLDVPIGFRRAHAAVQNSELLLAKDRAILREQERQIGHDLSNAIGEIDRAYEICQTNLNRYTAAKLYLDTLEANRRAGRPVDVDKILDAQNRVASSETRYFLTRVEYALAIKNINFEKGSLLEYHNLFAEDGVEVAKDETDKDLLETTAAANAVATTSEKATGKKPEAEVDFMTNLMEKSTAATTAAKKDFKEAVETKPLPPKEEVVAKPNQVERDEKLKPEKKASLVNTLTGFLRPPQMKSQAKPKATETKSQVVTAAKPKEQPAKAIATPAAKVAKKEQPKPLSGAAGMFSNLFRGRKSVEKQPVAKKSTEQATPIVRNVPQPPKAVIPQPPTTAAKRRINKLPLPPIQPAGATEEKGQRPVIDLLEQKPEAVEEPVFDLMLRRDRVVPPAQPATIKRTAGRALPFPDVIPAETANKKVQPVFDLLEKPAAAAEEPVFDLLAE